MPYGLKITVSIIGIIFVLATEYKVTGIKISDIVMFILWYGFAGTLIFLPWFINK